MILNIFFYTIFNSGMLLKFRLLCKFVYVKFHCPYVSLQLFPPSLINSCLSALSRCLHSGDTVWILFGCVLDPQFELFQDVHDCLFLTTHQIFFPIFIFLVCLLLIGPKQRLPLGNPFLLKPFVTFVQSR